MNDRSISPSLTPSTVWMAFTGALGRMLHFTRPAVTLSKSAHSGTSIVAVMGCPGGTQELALSVTWAVAGAAAAASAAQASVRPILLLIMVLLLVVADRVRSGTVSGPRGARKPEPPQPARAAAATQSSSTCWSPTWFASRNTRRALSAALSASVSPSCAATRAAYRPSGSGMLGSVRIRVVSRKLALGKAPAAASRRPGQAAHRGRIRRDTGPD